MRIKIILFILFFLIFDICLSQDLTTKSKKARKIYQRAESYYKARNYSETVNLLKQAIKADPNFIEAYMFLGDIYADKKDKKDAVVFYTKAISIDPEFYPPVYYILANLELSLGKYFKALKYYKHYLKYNKITDVEKIKAENNIKRCEFAINARMHPVPFNPINLGDSINTEDDEFVNAITADGQTLVLTVQKIKNRHNKLLFQRGEEDFYMSKKIKGKWSKAKRLGFPFNTFGNKGAFCISPDGMSLFFTVCYRNDGFGSCDLYYSKRIGGRWTMPVNMGKEVNSKRWDSQPSISSDGRTLYFASTRAGGKGDSDIWKTTLMPDGKWSEPVNLGDKINTKEEEMAPFIHPDDQTLYFSSKGHLGMGGRDIFFSRKDKKGNWTKPVNLGYPINTEADEINIIVDASAEHAYLSSDMYRGKGEYDIYSFNLYKKARPQKTTYMKGVVFDIKTKKRLEAKFELIDLATGKIKGKSFSDPVNGEFLVCIPTNRNYALNVSKDGYLFYSENFTLIGVKTNINPFLKNIPLKPIEAGENIVLKNIFFETDKFNLEDESKVELKILTDFLNNNPEMKIKINGHTDNVGAKAYNKNLSENRAKAVYDYLVANGITKDRLSFQGYGENKPIDTNKTEKGRANNRRTEFEVIKK